MSLVLKQSLPKQIYVYGCFKQYFSDDKGKDNILTFEKSYRQNIEEVMKIIMKILLQAKLKYLENTRESLSEAGGIQSEEFAKSRVKEMKSLLE